MVHATAILFILAEDSQRTRNVSFSFRPIPFSFIFFSCFCADELSHIFFSSSAFSNEKQKELGLLQHFFTEVNVLFGLTTDQTLPCLNKKISEAK